jgi:hypothetical protein
LGFELVIAPESDAQAVVSLATGKGWSDVASYAMSLDRETYPRLFLLSDQGWCDVCESLAAEIEAATRDEPPEDPEVADTLDDLLDNLDGRGEVPCYVGDAPDDDDDEPGRIPAELNGRHRRGPDEDA